MRALTIIFLLVVGWASAQVVPANRINAGPTTAPAAQATFRLLVAADIPTLPASKITGVALTKVDDTNVTLTLGGTPATSLLQNVSLTLGWTGTLAESRGGTGSSTFPGWLAASGATLTGPNTITLTTTNTVNFIGGRTTFTGASTTHPGLNIGLLNSQSPANAIMGDVWYWDSGANGTSVPFIKDRDGTVRRIVRTSTSANGGQIAFYSSGLDGTVGGSSSLTWTGATIQVTPNTGFGLSITSTGGAGVANGSQGILLSSSGSLTITNVSGGNYAELGIMGGRTTGSTNQNIFGIRNSQTYTISHTGASVVHDYFAPTLAGAQTPTHVYALQSTTGKIGLANYSNPTVTTGDFWFSADQPTVGIANSSRLLMHFTGAGIANTHIPFGTATGFGFVQSSANFTYNGTTLTVTSGSINLSSSSLVSTASNGAAPAVDLNTALHAINDGVSHGMAIRGTGGVQATSGGNYSAIHVVNTVGSSNTNQTYHAVRNTATYNANNANFTVKAYHFNPTAIGGSQTASITVKAWEHSTGFIQWASVLSPAQITSNQTDYNPNGLTSSAAPYGAMQLRINTDAARTIFSLGGGFDGRMLEVHNTGSFPITLPADDGSTGTAAQRFASAYIVHPGTVALLVYDGTSSRWRINGSTMVAATATKTTTYPVVAGDYLLLGDATSAGFDMDLPAAANCVGCIFVIKKVDSTGNAVSIDPNGTELIDGSSTSVTISTQWASKVIQSNGTSWFIIGN